MAEESFLRSRKGMAVGFSVVVVLLLWYSMSWLTLLQESLTFANYRFHRLQHNTEGCIKPNRINNKLLTRPLDTEPIANYDYWVPLSLPVPPPSSNPKYVAVSTLTSFHKKRVSIQFGIWIAYLLNRTLLIPDKQRFIGIDGEPHYRSLYNFFEIEHLKQIINVAPRSSVLGNDTHKEMLTVEVLEFTQAEYHLIDRIPVRDSKEEYFFERHLILHNQEKEVIPIVNAFGNSDKDLLLFNNLVGNANFMFFPPSITKLMRSMITNNFHYHSNLWNDMRPVVTSLSNPSYVCISPMSSSMLSEQLEELKAVVKPGETVFAISEIVNGTNINAQYREIFQSHKLNVKFLEDFLSVVTSDVKYLIQIDEEYQLVYDEIICALSRVFIPSINSRTSAHIAMLRNNLRMDSDPETLFVFNELYSLQL